MAVAVEVGVGVEVAVGVRVGGVVFVAVSEGVEVGVGVVDEVAVVVGHAVSVAATAACMATACAVSVAETFAGVGVGLQPDSSRLRPNATIRIETGQICFFIRSSSQGISDRVMGDGQRPSPMTF